VTEFSQVAVSALANNACINGGFESGDFTGWGEGRDGAGAVPASATWGSSGAGTSHNGPGILSWQLSGTQQMFGNKGRLPVIPGQIVRLGCWQRSSVGDEVVVGDNLKVGVVGFDAAGVYIPGSETTIATYIYAGSAVLRELTGTYSVPAGVAYVGFYLDGTFTGTWLVDDCYLSLLSPLEQKVVASYGLALDADGKTVGMYGYNDGVTGKLVFDFDEVDFLSGTSGSSITGGIIKQTKGGYMYVTGAGFGASSDLTMWYGPAQAVSACTKANAIAYADTSGHFHIESLTTGDIEFYGSSDSTAVPNTLTLTVDDTDGGPKTLTATYSGERHFISTSSTPQSGTATLSLWRKIGSGSYVQLGSNRTVTFTDDVNDYDGSRYIHDFTGSLSTTFTDSNTTTGQTFTYQWRLTARSQTVSIQNMSLRSVE
jgi:hypothetical protein